MLAVNVKKDPGHKIPAPVALVIVGTISVITKAGRWSGGALRADAVLTVSLGPFFVRRGQEIGL